MILRLEIGNLDNERESFVKQEICNRLSKL